MVPPDPRADVAEDGGRAPDGWRRRRRLALALGLPGAAVLAGLWAERRPIATHFIDRKLAASGVPARYRVADLGPGRQRLTGVVIGDPRRPDLVADWIETETGIGLGGPVLTGVRAGRVRVRVRGRLAGGRLSLGAIDRLLPQGGGRGGLPALSLDVADARLRLETPAGVVGAALAGRGRLDGGFDGRLTLVGTTLASGGCAAEGARGALRVRTSREAVRLVGPLAAERVACGGTSIAGPRVAVDATVDPSAPAWRGRVQLAGGNLLDPRARAASLAGSATFDGRPGATGGTLALSAAGVVAPDGGAGRVTATGRYALGAQSRFDGKLAVTEGRVGRFASLGSRVKAAAGTPVGPLLARAAAAIDAAGRSFAGSAEVSLAGGSGGWTGTVGDVALRSPGGARFGFDGRATLAGAIDGTASLGGGGLPEVTATVRRTAATQPLSGVVTMRPYAAGPAALGLAPASVTVWPDGRMRIATVATLSGPLASGRVEGLTLPIALRRGADGVVRVGEACASLTYRRLAIGGLRLDPARLVLCPTGGALVSTGAHGAVIGGVRTGPLRLAGRLGASPLALAATGVALAPAARGFTVTDVAATLGAGERATHFAAASLAGRFAAGGVAGDVAGAGGRLGAVPLLLSDAAGRWSFANGALDLAGALTVSDAEAAAPRRCPPAPTQLPAPRFCPLAVRDVTLRLADGRIAAAGTLAEPTTGTRVAGLRLDHDLASGAGSADLSVDRLSFAKGFQPDLLTPLTTGTIADVAGTIDGRGHIAWDGRGVTSSGRFATAGTDLAAAFGPVSGIAGAIEFTDLLGLVSAPGQEVTVASINPGIPVESGTVRFHLEPGTKVAVESARWPFAGGALTLDPTLLDFAAPAERHLTFRLEGVAADRFLQQFEFRNLAATGTFDGVLPMVFDASGGRIEGGRLTVREGGREGGGTLAYVGDVGQKDLGFWGNLAFQALKSLRYRSLAIAMNGPLEGEMVTEVRFAGVSQGAGAKSNFLISRLQRLPFVFNVRIRAPFRELIQTTNSFSDPSDLLRRNLPALIGVPGGAAAVQPGDTGAVPSAKRP